MAVETKTNPMANVPQHGNGFKRKHDEKNKKDPKEIKKQRQQSQPNYQVVIKAKELWNILREKKAGKDKRKQLVTELITLIRGKMHDIAAKHDASRIVQSVLQFGSPEQRSEVIKELREHIVELCKMQYGHFLVEKMIRYGSNSDRVIITKEFTGHVVKLGTHNIAANVLEYAHEWLKPSQLSGLRLEFYGNEYALFKSESKKTLSIILEENPSKREEIMKRLSSTISKMVDKELLGLAFVQNLIWEYFSSCTYDEKVAILPNLRDASAALLATRQGALVVGECLAYGNAKDRKRIIKSLKGKVFDACNHPSGYLVLLRAMDVVDDTVLIQKSLISELIPRIFDISTHQNGRKVLLQLLTPNNKRYLSPEEIKVLEPPMVPSPENKKEMILNYKKSPESKLDELLKGLRSHIEEMCQRNCSQLAISKFGSDVLVEAFKKWESDSIMEATASIAADESNEIPMYEHPVGHFTLQRLVKETNFFNCLNEKIKDQLPKWIESNRGCFVISSILDSNNEKVSDVKKILSSHVNRLKELQETHKGCKVLLEKLN